MSDFKPIAGYDRYGVSATGEVRGPNGPLSPFMSGNGYLQVTLIGADRKHYYVHRLVAETHLPNPDNLPQVNHKDENKLNNSAVNLEWCTLGDNIRHSRAKTYAMVDPDGKLVTITNLTKFCRDNSLTAACMHRVATGQSKSYKGWTKHENRPG